MKVGQGFLKHAKPSFNGVGAGTGLRLGEAPLMGNLGFFGKLLLECLSLSVGCPKSTQA